MTLKKLCKALNWQGKGIRRWKDFIEELQFVVAVGEDALRELEAEDAARNLIKKHISVASADEIKAAVERSPLGAGIQVLPCDRRYQILNSEGWGGALDYTGIDRIRYISEFFDCDNFALALAVVCAMKFHINSVGICLDFSGGHAYAILPVRQPDGSIEIVILEPQNDKYIISLGGMYQGKFGIAIFA
ncbi:MAG: hypothetical protein OXH00_26005 [Candidatus Poribacteria bacterium]|nr:hypothetical protein [Candidatus Poribacteria bacterium]